MIIAVALFSIVMLVCVSALLSLVAANRKAQALQSVMNNLNITLDGMARNIRMGSNYHCGASGTLTQTADCANSGDVSLAFEPYGNAVTDPPWVYSFNAGTSRIEKKVGAGASLTVTSSTLVAAISRSIRVMACSNPSSFTSQASISSVSMVAPRCCR